MECIEATLPLAMGDQPMILTDIYQPEHNIAIWQRNLTKEVSNSIQQMLDTESQLALVKIVTPKEAAELVSSKLSQYDCAEFLARDVALIVDMFCCLFEVKEAGLRLTVLDKPMCPKFHVDQVPCRLVTTYVGQATEWIATQDVDSDSLIEKQASAIQRMSPGDVALLKGGGWEGNEGNALVHRSPKLNPNERRLLLTLDMV